MNLTYEMMQVELLYEECCEWQERHQLRWTATEDERLLVNRVMGFFEELGEAGGYIDGLLATRSRYRECED